MSSSDGTSRLRLLVGVSLLVLFGGLTVGTMGPNVGSPATDQPAADAGLHQVDASNSTSEAEFVVEAPEPGDQYSEMSDPDGDWISYVNPRNEYRDPYDGEGSGKICVALFNENGEVVEGRSLPNTTVEIPTGDSLDWHSSADPMTVRYPLTDHYERPLDSDQFGTAPDLPQGDGYMDAHCIEVHGLSETANVTYGEPIVEGPRADRVNVVGYVQQAGDAWDSDVHPLRDAEPYEQAGGWTYEPGESHGQAVVVLQLDRQDTTPDENTTSGDDCNQGQHDETASTEGESDCPNERDQPDGASTPDSETPGSPEESSDGNDEENVAGTESRDETDGDTGPGFGVPVAIASVSIVVLLRTRR